MNLFTVCIGLMAMVLLPARARVQSPWPAPLGSLSYELGYTVERFDTFYKGKNRTQTSDHVYQYSEMFSLEYRLTDDLTLDFATGYSHSPKTYWSSCLQNPKWPNPLHPWPALSIGG